MNESPMHRVLILLIAFISGINGAVDAQSKIRWVSWQEAQELSKKEKKKIFVDIYTDWCGWCKKMDKTTLSDEKVIEFINTHYYAVRFDAETKQEIDFRGKTYGYTRYGSRGYHELATFLLHGRMSFPSLAFLDEQFNLIQAIPGYQEPRFFLMIATYFGENAHKNTPWNRYMDEFEQRH